VSIRVKFGSSKEKITTRRMYIYLIPDTYAALLLFLTEKISKYMPYYSQILSIIFFCRK